MPIKLDDDLHNENRNINPEEFAGNTLGGKFGNTLIRTIRKLIDSTTDWFEDRLVNFSLRVMKNVEKSGSMILSELIKELKDKKAIPAFMKPIFDEMENPQHEFGAMLLQSAGGSAVGGIMGAIFDPLMANVKYQLNSLITPYIPGIADLIAHNIRSGVGEKMTEDFFEQNGYSKDYVSFYKTLARNYIDITAINDAQNRGLLTESECITRLKSLGYIEDDANIIYQLFTKIPDINTSILSWFRGDITENKLNEIAEKNDINKEFLDIIISANRMVLNLNDIREIYYRDKKDDKWLTEKFTTLGLTKDRMEDLKKIFPFQPPIQDLVAFADRLVWDDDYVKLADLDADMNPKVAEEAAKVGVSADWVKYYWRYHWLPIDLQLGFEMLHRGVITLDEMKTFLKAQHIPPGLQKKYIEVAFNPLTRVDVRRMHKTGVVTDGELVKLYMALGYSEENATRLQQFTIRLNTVATDSVGAAEKDLTKAEILDGYARKFFSLTEATSYLTSLGYDSKEVEYYLAKVDYKEYQDIKKQQLDMYEEMYKKGILDDNQVIIDLSSFGLEAPEINYNLYKWALAKKNKPGKPSVLDLKNWLKAKIIDAQFFQSEMSSLGYSDIYINLYYKEIKGTDITG